MDSMSAFAIGKANRGKPSMVFDWDKCARLIRERKPSVVRAGLATDWEYTGGEIYRNGAIVSKDDTYIYLASTWATPEIEIDGDMEDCFVMEDARGWDAKTYWPESALAILNAEDER